ncbi:hypothetical protein NRIC_36810 [Enterococcus florum]|uniref:YicC family protein n=1 Tax=Enterococcus florum TaxID=2480627 RepID=A0A4P5PCF8_9ENTE|nr:YicC/YloC family endoribonuclease [Enterococcus florum]GCF95790.1 hypothetical protein NRIC_36810 [Enterococcus florum]
MKSMTGYGQATKVNDAYELSIELKSVNNRFLDFQIRMPKELNPFETMLRKIAKEQVQRGRVDMYVNLTTLKSGNKQVVVQWELLEQLVGELTAGAKERFGSSALSPEEIVLKSIELPDYVTILDRQEADETLEQLVKETAIQAFQELVKSREAEGSGIKAVLMGYQQDVAGYVEELKGFVAVYEADFQKRYETKLQECLGGTVDQDRLLTELAILLERGDIHEELDRLAIHLEKMNHLLQSEEPIGRELDFLMQELNREVNTIGSKSSPIQIKDIVVQLKTILEKIREQIQNVE